jgi:hypothetical protein
MNHIACVAPARIRHSGARNGTPPTCSELP